MLFGDSYVGKTSIINRLVDDIYSNDYNKTIGADFKYNLLKIGNDYTKLQLWDVPGQDRYSNSYYCKGIQIIIICYDITNENSFKNIKIWLREIEKYGCSDPKINICGTKLDLRGLRQVSYETAKSFCDERSFNYFEVSSKNNDNVDEMFKNIIYEANFSTIDITKNENNIILGAHRKKICKCY
jgi:Ras-related protein Rab-1A